MISKYLTEKILIFIKSCLSQACQKIQAGKMELMKKQQVVEYGSERLINETACTI